MSTLLCLIGLVLTSAAAIVCPDATWLERNGKCYSKRGMGTHTDCATTICGANASLVHITPPDENTFVQFESRGSRVWIGYYKITHPADPHADGLWGRWTSSSEMTDGAYTNWATYQPSDGHEAENCAIMWSDGSDGSDGTWNDDRCTRTFACLCEYPASTTREYAEMVPLLEEDLFTLHKTTTFRVVLACVLTGIAIMQELKAKAKKISRIYYKAAPTEKEAKTDEFDEGRAPRRNSRRSSQRSVSIHLQHVREEITDKNATANLGVARLDVTMVMAGVRLSFKKKGPQVIETVVRNVVRVATAWSLIYLAAVCWRDGVHLLGQIAASFVAWWALANWLLHSTVASMFVDDPTHLLFMTAAAKRDDVAWARLRAGLNPTLRLVCVTLLCVGFVFTMETSYNAGPIVGIITFVGCLAVLSTMILFIISLRLLSAGHVGLLKELERQTIEKLRETPEGDALALCSCLDDAEMRVAGAMAVSNRKMFRAIWMLIVLVGFGTSLLIFAVRFFVHYDIVLGVISSCLLFLMIWALILLLNVLRSVGDALDDFVESMLKINNSQLVSKFFGDEMYLANRLKEYNTTRRLTWVLITDPVDSKSTANAIGAVVLSAAFVFYRSE